MEKLFTVASSPHIHHKQNVQGIMRDVIIALIPAFLVGIYLFGLKALWTTLVCVLSCVVFEGIWQKLTHQKITIGDLSAVVTGMLLAFNLPADIPVYVPVVGAFVAIILAKQMFGGIGQNFINPALAARAFLLASYPTAMTDFTKPDRFIGTVPINIVDATSTASAIDTFSGATPLVAFKLGESSYMPSLMDAFLGNIGGCLGEVCALALLVGGVYLIYRKVITWHIPVCYLGALFIVTLLFSDHGFYESFTSLFLGGAMLGAFFMATDYTTTPMTRKGQILFAVMGGILAGIIRLFGGYPEGVSYSILLMNLTVPLIDKLVKPVPFGGEKIWESH